MIDREHFFDTIRERPFGGSLTQGQVNGMNTLLDTWEKEEAFAQCYPRDGNDFIAYALATVFHETAATMQPIEEYGQGEGKSYGEPTGPYDKCYYGRGHVQLTWEENYKKAEEQIKDYGIDAPLHHYPELMLKEDVSAMVLFDGMIDGWFTGVGLSDYFNVAKESMILTMPERLSMARIRLT